MEEMINISEAGTQLRFFVSQKNQEEYYRVGALPYIRSIRLAAEWIRRNGSPSLTNQSFREVLSDITRRVISDEEADTVRLLSGVVANMGDSTSCASFVTKEECTYISSMVKSGEIDEIRLDLIQTVLGPYIQIGPEHTYEVDLD